MFDVASTHNTFTLHHYQLKLVDECREAMGRGLKRIVAYLPTAGGKTVVAMGIIQMALEKGKRVAFICNRVQLIEQTSVNFSRYGIKHGIIQGSNTRDHKEDVVVASIQTIKRRGLDHYDLLILDECHACAGTKAYETIMGGKLVIGLTATPYQRGLGRKIEALGGPIFESVIAGTSMRELIDTGYLVNADVWAPADPDLRGVKVVAGDYQEDQLAKAMDDGQLVGDIVNHWIRIAHGKQTMVFAVNIAHSQHICSQFVSNSVNAVHVDYHMTDSEKTRIYQDFREGRIMVLCNCALLSEGADFPSAEVLILARPTKSKVRFVQMFGRVLRTSAETGKTKAIVLDHSGSVQRLGFPWDFRTDHLDTGKPLRATGGAEDPPEPLPTPCPKCSLMRPPRTNKCPSCGFETKRPCEIANIEGELRQLNGNQEKPTPKQGDLQKQGRESVFKQLCWMARDRKKSDGWIKANYKNIFGTWPRQPEGYEKPTIALLSWIQYKNMQWNLSQKRAKKG